MASRSLGVLTLSLIGEIGGFEQGMDKAARIADKRTKEIEATLQRVGVAAIATGTALGLELSHAISLAANAYPELIEQAARFADIADKTGGSAEGFANFAVSAKVAGVEIDAIADASTKLSKNLVGVDDESKSAGAGLKALGINIADFKKLRPDEQIKGVANAFAGFADGADKAAVAQQLFGKGGAELLKFFKDYTENGGDVRILTADMIKQADDFADAHTRLKTEIGLTLSALGTSAIGPITAFTTVMKDAITQTTGLGTASTDLANNQGVRLFAENVGRSMAAAVDYVTQTGREFKVIADFVTAYAQSASTFSFQPVDDFKKQYGLNAFFVKTQKTEGEQAARTFVQSYNHALAGAKRATFANTDPRRVDLGKDGKPKDDRPNLNATTTTKTGGKTDRSAEQEAKAQLVSDLDAIKNAQEAFANAYSNNEKILAAMRSAGLVEEGDYYQQKKALLDANTSSQINAQQQAIERLQQEKLTGKDGIDNAKKVADAQAQLAKIRENAAAQAKVLGIEEESAFNKIKNALLSARQAAQDYFDTTARGYQRDLAGIGQGTKFREMQSAISQIEDRYQQARQDLQNQRSQAELAGTFGPQAAKQYQEQLAIISEFQSKAIDSYTGYYDKLNAAQKDWLNGAKEALANYSDEAGNVAKHTEEAFTNAFKGLEDQLTNLFTGKKFDSKALLDSIASEGVRNAVKEGITGPLAKWGKELLGDSGGGIASLLGLGKGAGAAGSAASMAALTASTTGASSALAALTAAASSASVALGGSSGGSGLGSVLGLFGGSGGGTADVLGDFIKLNGFASGGYTGSGAPGDVAGIVHKGEYVLNARETATIGVGNLQAGRYGSGSTFNTTINVPPSYTRATGDQLAADYVRKLDRSTRNR
jgi:lambda family phage tail tape measure protein